MTLILDRRFSRTLDALLARFGRDEARGTELQAWIFDDAPARRDAEARLARFGVRARLRSAYKPLLHSFLEEVDRDGLTRVRVRHPVHPAAAPNRFRLEAYPLAALVGDAEIAFEPVPMAAPCYRVDLAWTDGRREELVVFAPNRLHADSVGEAALSPTGWLNVGAGAPEEGERLETEFEALFAAAIEAVDAQGWRGQGPFFGELRLSATLPFAETRLAVGEETVSLQEALHEDLYFSLLEVFGARAGLKRGARGMRPGQIVPDIRHAPGTPRLRIETLPLSAEEPEGWDGEIGEARAPLSAAAVRRALDAVDGEAFAARSTAGRLAGVPGLLAFTERQLALYRSHSGEPGFDAVNGFPCLFTVNEEQAVPLTLITEYPDETVYGEAFLAAHRAQMEAILGAYDALQKLDASDVVT